MFDKIKVFYKHHKLKKEVKALLESIQHEPSVYNQAQKTCDFVFKHLYTHIGYYGISEYHVLESSFDESAKLNKVLADAYYHISDNGTINHIHHFGTSSKLAREWFTIGDGYITNLKEGIRKFLSIQSSIYAALDEVTKEEDRHYYCSILNPYFKELLGINIFLINVYLEWRKAV